MARKNKNKKPTVSKNNQPKKFVIELFHPLQAVVIAEDFNNKFYSLSDSYPLALTPLAGVPLIAFTINYLIKSKVKEIIICCKSHTDKIREYVESSAFSYFYKKVKITVVGSKGYSSTGDVLRDLYNKSMVPTHFILVNKLIISHYKGLKMAFNKHKKRCEQDKGAVLTSVFSKQRHSLSDINKHEALSIMRDRKTNKIVFCDKRIDIKQYPAFPDEGGPCDFQEWSQFSEIAICSPTFLSLFVDNFDFENISDFMKSILHNEEILGNTMYIEWSKQFTIGIDNFNTYSFATQYYLTFLRNYPKFYTDATRFVNKSSTIGTGCTILKSVVGKNCTIGNNVVLKDAYLWDNVTIGDNCKLEECFIASNVSVKKNVTLNPGCVLFSNTIVGPDVSIPNCTIVQEHSVQASNLVDSYNEPIGFQKTELDRAIIGAESKGYCFDGSAVSQDEVTEPLEPAWGKDMNGYYDKYIIEQAKEEEPEEELEDCDIFYNEVMEVFMRGKLEKIENENTIVEINSLKYAYNISLNDLVQLILKAIVFLPMNLNKDIQGKEYLAALTSSLQDFQSVLQHYMRDEETQMDYIISLVKAALESEVFGKVLVKTLLFLYNMDLLSEDVLSTWHLDSEPIPGVESDDLTKIKEQVAPLIKWLEEADEEESDDED